MERSVLVMLSDRSSAPTLLGWRPSARNSLGRSQKRFQLLTKIIFCSLHHENNHSFKANSLLNFSCPRRYVGRGPDTMIVAAGDVLRTVSIRLLKSLFSVSVWRLQIRTAKLCREFCAWLSASQGLLSPLCMTSTSNAAKAELLKSSRTQITLVTVFSFYCHLASASRA